MDMNEVFAAIAEHLRIDARLLSSQIQHRGSKGRVRELALVEQLLRTYLPRNVSAIHSAEVTSVGGETSGELDIVIFDQQVPPLLDLQTYRILPVECVYGVIEVKSQLDGAALKDALATIRKVKTLPRDALGVPHNQVNYLVYDKSWAAHPPTGFVFAYDSMSLATIRDQLTELQSEAPLPERIDSVWVLNGGYVVNWVTGTETIEALPDSTTSLRAGETDNPLPLFVSHLQEVFQEITTPPLRLDRYLSEATPVRWLKESSQS